MTTAKVTMGQTTARTSLDADSFAPNLVVPFSSLTKSFIGASGVHLSAWPGWCDPTASRTTDTGGNGAAIRTAQTGARLVLPSFTGSTFCAVRFDDSIWDSTNGLGKAWFPRPSLWCYRYLDNGVYSSWTYAVRPGGSSGGWVIKDGLDPTHTYQFEIEPTHFTDHYGYAVVSNVPLIDYMREPEITGTVNFPQAEQTAFQQLDALILSPGASYGTVTLTGTPKYFKVFADSNSHGLVLKETGQPTAFTWDSVSSTYVEVDARGHRATGIRRAIESFCAANGWRPVIHHASYGGLFLADVPDSVFDLYASLGVYSLASPPINRISARYGYWKINPGGAHTKESRVDPAGITFDYVIVALVTNDQVVGVQALTVWGGASPEFASFSGVAYANAVIALGNAIHAAHASAQVLFVNNQLSDSGAFFGLVQSHTLFQAACGVGGLNFPQSWGAYIDIRTISTSIIPDDFTASLHMNYTQHGYIATLVETGLDGLTP